MGTITIQIPDYLLRHVGRLVAEDGMSVDQFFATAAAEKLSVIEAFDYLASRAFRANDAAFLEALSHIRDSPVTDFWTSCREQQRRLEPLVPRCHVGGGEWYKSRACTDTH